MVPELLDELEMLLLARETDELEVEDWWRLPPAPLLQI